MKIGAVLTFSAVFGLGCLVGRVHERWSRTRWIRSLPTRDPADMTEEF